VKPQTSLPLPKNFIELNPYLDSLEKENLFSGVVYISQGNDVLFEKAYGYTNCEKTERVKIESRFLLASVTKMFTSVLTVKLFSKLNLSLKLSIAEILPELVEKSKITVHHLLSHQSGLPYFDGLKGILSENDRQKNIRGDLLFSPEEYISLIKRMPLKFKPGHRQNYSSINFILIGIILEKITGLTFAELLNEHILIPLELTNTGFVDSHSEKKLASGMRMNNGKCIEQRLIHQLTKAFHASSSLYSNARDLGKWRDAVFSGDFLSDTERNLIFSRHSKIRFYYYQNYGLMERVSLGPVIGGLFSRKHHYYEHIGMPPGYRACILTEVKNGHNIILLSNLGNGIDIKTLRDTILDIL